MDDTVPVFFLCCVRGFFFAEAVDFEFAPDDELFEVPVTAADASGVLSGEFATLVLVLRSDEFVDLASSELQPANSTRNVAANAPKTLILKSM